jgi:fucose 4-O-acetylase-like acetyltransferase
MTRQTFAPSSSPQSAMAAEATLDAQQVSSPRPATLGSPASSNPARIGWIDACKGLCMIGIVMSHNGPVMDRYPLLLNMLFSCLVPLFFFTSGLTLKIDSQRPRALERAASLLGSYAVLSIAVLPYVMLKNRSAELPDVLAGILYGSGHTMAMTPLWFVPCLALALAANHLLLLKVVPRLGIRPSRPLLVGLGLALALGGSFSMAATHYRLEPVMAWGSITTSGMVWGLDLVPIALGFLLLGQSTSANGIRNLIHRHAWQAFGLMLVLLCLSAAVLSNFSIHADLNMRIFTPPLPAFLMAVCGATALIIAATLLSFVPGPCRFFTALGQASLTILWFHNALQNSIAKWLFADLIPSTMAFGLTAFLFSMTIPVVLDRFVLRRVPLLSRLIFPRFRFSSAEEQRTPSTRK